MIISYYLLACSFLLRLPYLHHPRTNKRTHGPTHAHAFHHPLCLCTYLCKGAVRSGCTNTWCRTSTRPTGVSAYWWSGEIHCINSSIRPMQRMTQTHQNHRPCPHIRTPLTLCTLTNNALMLSPCSYTFKHFPPHSVPTLVPRSSDDSEHRRRSSSKY